LAPTSRIVHRSRIALVAHQQSGTNPSWAEIGALVAVSGIVELSKTATTLA
jgi:hypothetical protein